MSKSNPAITVEISPGELIDKLTILAIKRERIADQAKLANIRTEQAALEEARQAALPASPELDALEAELKEVNTELWQIEDGIRLCEAEGRFDADFVALARAVYTTNDRRAALKKRIDTLLGARFSEEKSYAG